MTAQQSPLGASPIGIPPSDRPAESSKAIKSCIRRQIRDRLNGITVRAPAGRDEGLRR
jgi:hypothetical protein